MPGHDIFQPLFFRKAEQTVEFHIPVAVDTGVGRTAGLVNADELFDDPAFEVHGEVQNLIGHVQLKGHLAGVVNIPLGAAGVKLAQADIRVAVQPHGGAFAVKAPLLHQIGGNGAVYSAAHGDECAFFLFVRQHH